MIAIKNYIAYNEDKNKVASGKINVVCKDEKEVEELRLKLKKLHNAKEVYFRKIKLKILL